MTHPLTTPKGTLTIRPALPEDAAALRLLRIEGLADTPEAFAADLPAAQAETVERWAERIANNALENSGVICVAASADRLVGMTGLGRGHWPKTRHSAVIWGVYVSPEWRSAHLAETLIEECIAWGRAQEVEIAKLGVITTNLPAIRCYTRCGFSVYGLEPRAICCNGVYYDELLMSRKI